MFVKNILRQEIAWFDKVETGDLSARLISDISMIQEGLSEKNALMIQYVTTFLSGFAIAYAKGWKLALVLSSVIPPMGIASAYVSKLLAEESTEGLGAYAGAGAIAKEVLSSIRTVVAFNGQTREVQRYNKKLDEAQKIGIKKAVISGIGIGVGMNILLS